MDQPGGEPPRRAPQNSTPPPLKVTKDSHKVRKPSPAPNRQPVIIYEVDPTVRRVDPSGFMGLVQQLTGPPDPAINRPPPPSEIERTGYGHSISGQPRGPGSSTFSLPPQEPSPYIRLHHQQYPIYDTCGNSIRPPGPSSSSSSNAFISDDDDFPYDYFNSDLYKPQQDDDDQ